MKYDHYGDRSVAVAVALVNTYGTVPRTAARRADRPLDGLAAFLRAHDLDDRGVRPRDARAAQQLADRLHGVLTATDDAEAVALLNDELAAADALPQVSGHGGSDWHLHYHRADAPPVERLAAITAMGLATVLCTAGRARLGQCDGVACRDVYVDTSRNRRRRYCSDGCANRAHVAAHRRRERGGATT